MQVKDSIEILKKTNFKKMTNAIKLYSSFWLSRLKKKPTVWGVPLALSIEPTTACNLGCPECPSGLKQFTRPTGNLSLELNKKIIDDLHKELIYINYYFQGEPFIHPHFLKMVEYADKKGIYTSASTNAHFISQKIAEETVKSGLKRLIISLDGTTQKIYEQYRVHGELEKVIEGTKRIVDAKKKLKSTTPHVIFQFLVVAPNEHQIEDAKQLAREIGVNEIKFKTAQVYDYKNGNRLIPENEKYSRYKKGKDGKYTMKSKLNNHCWRMWSSSVITWDGRVSPCCFDKDASYQFGDLSSSSFGPVWKSEAYTNFRKQVFTSRKEIDICTNCSEGSKVWT